ncbi:hypothetical protein TNCV_2074241 [Trichonephila clavipes]|nr:hypothetical protein TNCV_2074241 [Trichonephila clavipes]
MKQEKQLFNLTENPSPNNIRLCDALKTIPLTSVEAEGVFSAAGLFVTKLRTRAKLVLEPLSDDLRLSAEAVLDEFLSEKNAVILEASEKSIA